MIPNSSLLPSPSLPYRARGVFATSPSPRSAVAHCSPHPSGHLPFSAQEGEGASLLSSLPPDRVVRLERELLDWWSDEAARGEEAEAAEAEEEAEREGEVGDEEESLEGKKSLERSEIAEGSEWIESDALEGNEALEGSEPFEGSEALEGREWMDEIEWQQGNESVEENASSQGVVGSEAPEGKEQLCRAVRGTDLLFVTCDLGGEASHAAPLLAQYAKVRSPLM